MAQALKEGIIPRPKSILFQPCGKVTALEIILDRRDGPNGFGVYLPGDLLSGHVRLELSQRLTVNNIDLLVQGTGSVAWRQRNAQGSEETCSDDEVYLNDIAELVAKRVNEMVTLSAGEHIFPFACDLPLDLPATFTGTHGKVSYLVKVVLQADRNEPEHTEPCIATSLFLLESRLGMEGMAEHLNAYRVDYKHPIKASALTAGSSAVKVALFLPRRAYDIGDSIVVNMTLTNTSKKAVTKMSLGLVMETTYRANNTTKTEHLLVADHEDQFVVRHSERRMWQHAGITVPRYIPPTGLPHSTLMNVKYWLVFKAEIEQGQDCATIYTPVLIGLELPNEIKLSAAGMESPLEVAGSGLQRGAQSIGSSRDQSSQGIIYRGSQDPSFPPTSSTTTTTNSTLKASVSSAAVQRPLYIETTKLERQLQVQPQPQRQPQLQPQPPQLQTQYLQPPASETHFQPIRHQQHHQHQHQQQHQQEESDSQVISMRFTDELDDHSPYNHQAKVSRNPLFVPENEPNGYQSNGHAYDEQRNQRLNGNDHMMKAMGASLNNGVEEVLY